MNERLFASKVTAVLDESADRLPYKLSHRLERAREAALARLPAETAVAVAPGALALGPAAALSGPPAGGDDRPSWLWRALAVVVPPLVVAAGLYGIAEWTDSQDVQELVDVDSAVLTDEVPLSAYADRGFGVYLNNNARQ